jgi:hypothetical protein
VAQAHAAHLISLDAAGKLPNDSATGEPEAGAPPVVFPSEPGAGSLDKIRDILFGAQRREFESRFTRLEENLLREIAALREDTKKRFDALETYTTSQFDMLQDRIKGESDERLNCLRQLTRALSELENLVSTRLTVLQEQASQGDRQLSLELLQQAKEFTENLRRNQDESSALVERRFQELQKRKADRAALAGFLNEVAMRLNDEMRIATTEG